MIRFGIDSINNEEARERDFLHVLDQGS